MWNPDSYFFSELTAVAEFCNLEPSELDMHVEGLHGFEPHDNDYALAVWHAAGCLLGVYHCNLLEEDHG